MAGGNTAGCNLTPDPSATIFLLDAITGEVRQTLVGSLCDVRSLGWNADGSRLVSADFDSTFRIWDPLTGQQVAESEPNRSRTDVVWSPDNTKIANIWGDHFIVELLDANTVASLKILGLDPRFARYKILSVDWSPGSTQLVSVGRKSLQSPDSFLHVWDVETGELLIEEDLQGIATHIDWNAEGSQIIVGARDGTISVFNTASYDLANRFSVDESLTYVKWHPFLSVVAIGSTSETSSLTIWEIEDGTPRQIDAVEGTRGIGDWSPFGGRFVFVPSPFEVPTDNDAEPFSTLVPLASLDLLEGIMQRCEKVAATDSDLTVPSTEALLPDFIDAVSASEELTPACAADLTAVAVKLQGQ